MIEYTEDYPFKVYLKDSLTLKEGIQIAYLSTIHITEDIAIAGTVLSYSRSEDEIKEYKLYHCHKSRKDMPLDIDRVYMISYRTLKDGTNLAIIKLLKTRKQETKDLEDHRRRYLNV